MGELKKWVRDFWRVIWRSVHFSRSFLSIIGALSFREDVTNASFAWFFGDKVLAEDENTEKILAD